MNSSNPTGIRQPHSRSRARRARRNHAAAEPLPNQLLLRRPGSHDGLSITQTLERPQQTGTLWEPGRLYPPRPRRAENQQRRTHPQARPQDYVLPSSSSSSSSSSAANPDFPAEDGDAVANARKARMTEYLSSWDKAWAAASTKPDGDDDVPDIGGMEISETPTSTTERLVSFHEPTTLYLPCEVIGSKSISEPGPPKSPKDSDGGVVIPQEEQTEARPHPTAAVQLAELKAKIPWLVEQRTVDGAGWRPLGEYYWAIGGSKRAGP